MWSPVITDSDLVVVIKKKINEIQHQLKDEMTKNIGLLSGQPGIVLFKSYFARYTDTDNSSCGDNVGILFDSFERTSQLNFSVGLAGVIHTLSILENEDFFDFDNEIKNIDFSVFEEFLKDYKKVKSIDNLDYLHGTSGVILSFLEQNIDKKYDYLFDIWLASIENLKEPDPEYLKWKIKLMVSENTFEDGYCFGLAHGVPSIIIILLKLYKRNKSAKTLEYLNKSISFLLSTKCIPSTMYYFPTQIINNVSKGGRIAWCYGDLGCAISLFLSGQYLNRQDLIHLAIEIFTEYSSKRDCKLYNIVDADFCHGTVGIAHMYARMYNYTKIELFRETAQYWYVTTLEKAIYNEGFAGFMHHNGNGPKTKEFGLLEGISGIGLSLISSISDIEPKWDATLLLS